MKGKVKFFNENKGYGFITGEDEKEYFVHISGLAEGLRVSEDDAITFDIEDGNRGPKATNVQMDNSEGSSDDSEEESDEE